MESEPSFLPARGHPTNPTGAGGTESPGVAEPTKRERQDVLSPGELWAGREETQNALGTALEPEPGLADPWAGAEQGLAQVGTGRRK